MSCCARCGQGICSTAGKIALNKVWHKSCFCCYNCSRPLQINTAKIFYGEVFCACCCPQNHETYPLKVCRVNSTPSCNADCSVAVMKPACCNSDETPPFPPCQECCRPRDVHSCSCIPVCCKAAAGAAPCGCRDCEDACFKRIHCRPRSPKPLNYPPRQRRCGCPQCRPASPKRRPCPEPCAAPAWRKPACAPPPQCCDGKKKMIFFQPCPKPCPNPKATMDPGCRYCNVERCRRCGEKVFAAEKVPTTHGAYHLGCFTCYCCCKSLCVKSMYEACGEIYCRQCYNNYFGVCGYRYCC